jgi:ribosomal 30S subunit maturation factor RimM
VTDVIHQTPPPATVSKIVFAETAEVEGAAAEATGVETTEAETGEAEATGAEAGTTEESNLETTLEVIDNILLKMAEKEATVAAVNTTTEKGKEQIDEISEEGDFNFQDLLGQELTDAEKEELKKICHILRI